MGASVAARGLGGRRLPLEAGQELLHYRLIEKIGEGGMGAVWRAEDTKLRRQVALKVLPEAMAEDPERRARFAREARAVAALSHPNIVTIHSVDEAPCPSTSSGPSASSGQASLHFITMELVEGKTLGELLPEEGFPLGRLLEIAIPLTDAVSRAHRAGITHRDLKPDNVMIDREGRLRVLDFGLAKLQEMPGDSESTALFAQGEGGVSDTAEGKVLGTVAYMSPEQSEGKPVAPSSDVFSLGTILYEMATGQRPFRGDTAISTIGSILKDEPRSITDVKPQLPRHAGRIVRRCLAKDPERRYQSALELRNELQDLADEIASGIHDAPPAGATPGRAASSRGSRAGFYWIMGAALVTTVVVWGLVKGMMGEGEPLHERAIATSRPVTASSAWETSPTWSPDGTLIAFERMDSGHLDIWVKPADGGEAVVRVSGPGDQYSPRWTADGRHLTYMSSVEPGHAIYLIPADGGKPKKLIDTNIPTLAYEAAMGDRPWAPDGKSALVSLAGPSRRIAVYRVDRETGESEQLTFPPAGSEDSGASYSFDGETIVFTRQVDAHRTLMTMPAAGGEPRQLLDEPHDLWNPVWRPDGRRVVFTSKWGGLSDNLFDVDAVTKEVRQLTFGTQDIQTVSVSEDDRIVYNVFWHDTFIHRVDVETGVREQITSHARNNGMARYSPDGKTLAYGSDRTGDFEIWLHRLGSGEERRFTSHPAIDGAPEWSPDGSRLVFRSNRDGGGQQLYIANVDGGTAPRPLVEGLPIWTDVNNPWSLKSRWSPDGESISFSVPTEEGQELWTVGPDGSGARKRHEDLVEFDWYLDARRGLLTRLRGSETELYAVDLESGREELLFVGGLQEIDVAPDGSAVSFCLGRGHLSMGLAVLKLELPDDARGLPRAVGEPEYLVTTEGTWHVHAPSWAPDSKSIVYTEDTDYGSLYELIEK